MSNQLNIEIRDFEPEKVYVFPQLLTRAEILKKVKTVHTIANDEADREVYCLFDKLPSLDAETPMQYEVCFPVTHLNLKKYNIDDFRIFKRETIVTSPFSGDFEDLINSINVLIEHAENNGYKTVKPYRFLFILDKKTFLSNKPQKFRMEIQIPVEKCE